MFLSHINVCVCLSLKPMKISSARIKKNKNMWIKYFNFRLYISSFSCSSLTYFPSIRHIG